MPFELIETKYFCFAASLLGNAADLDSRFTALTWRIATSAAEFPVIMLPDIRLAIDQVSGSVALGIAFRILPQAGQVELLWPVAESGACPAAA